MPRSRGASRFLRLAGRRARGGTGSLQPERPLGPLARLAAAHAEIVEGAMIGGEEEPKLLALPAAPAPELDLFGNAIEERAPGERPARGKENGGPAIEIA